MRRIRTGPGTGGRGWGWWRWGWRWWWFGCGCVYIPNNKENKTVYIYIPSCFDGDALDLTLDFCRITLYQPKTPHMISMARGIRNRPQKQQFFMFFLCFSKGPPEASKLFHRSLHVRTLRCEFKLSAVTFAAWLILVMAHVTSVNTGRQLGDETLSLFHRGIGCRQHDLYDLWESLKLHEIAIDLPSGYD